MKTRFSLIRLSCRPDRENGNRRSDQPGRLQLISTKSSSFCCCSVVLVWPRCQRSWLPPIDTGARSRTSPCLQKWLKTAQLRASHRRKNDLLLHLRTEPVLQQPARRLRRKTPLPRVSLQLVRRKPELSASQVQRRPLIRSGMRETRMKLNSGRHPPLACRVHSPKEMVCSGKPRM